MQLKYSNIDVETCSVADIDSEIVRLEKMVGDYNSLQNGVKVFINSIYGACASPFFTCYNVDIAEAITLQGQDLAKHTGNTCNNYFSNFWHKDKELHKKLGVTVTSTVQKDVWIYSDTDSIHVCLQYVIDTCEHVEDEVQFIINLYEHRLKALIKTALEKYATKWNTTNYQNAEFEKLSEGELVVAKKKYVMDIKWENGITRESHTKIKPVGIEIVQSSTPLFSRKNIKDVLKEIFTQGEKLDIKQFVANLKRYKAEFCASEVDYISKQMGVGDYEKGIANDRDKFEFNKAVPAHVRGAGYHNYLINQNPKLKKKYSLLKSGDKVKFYYTDDKFCNIFSYAPGFFPHEIAPGVDWDEQFDLVFLSPINRLLEPVIGQKIKPSLSVSKNLF